LKKLNVTAVSGVEEVNMFKDDGNVLHFASPRGECVSPGSHFSHSTRFAHGVRDCCFRSSSEKGVLHAKTAKELKSPL
jgi:hypothetical protein